ncbi:MAG: diphosphomevalonate decarboxylase [Anaerolineales bacterium]|nr:diphosphomevalonate decarboxylase [Anaerolineales bacterium]
MTTGTATAQAHPNIAFIKYWGNKDQELRIPVNGSLSMNLDGLFTQTTVTFNTFFPKDSLTLNNKPITGAGLDRVTGILDLVRQRAGMNTSAEVRSDNNFPTGTGIASSAAAFAALALAASTAAGLHLDEQQLSILARRGSGSASRSIPGGFVEWQAGADNDDSYAFSFAPAEHWNLADCIAVISSEHKPTISSQGHTLASTSPLQAARIADAPRRIDICRQAILNCDFEALAAIVELDSDMMHAVMMTSTPALFYWRPATLAVIQAVRDWRSEGLPVCYTIDAGPNVHVLCPQEYVETTANRLRTVDGVQEVLVSKTGGPAKLV